MQTTTRFSHTSRRRRVASILRAGSLAALMTASVPPQLHAAGLVASDAVTFEFDYFGIAASQSSSSGLIGAYVDTIGANREQGSAYLFRNLNTATGTITQNVKLTASDGAAYDQFGISASLSGSIGLVGANRDGIGANAYQGSAYIFRNLHTAIGTITENVKLTASDGAAHDEFGRSASISGSIGLVGAIGDDIWASDQGSAYVYRNLNTATGTITQNVKLIASDGGGDDQLGISTSLSGSIGLVGAYVDDIGANSNQGSAYIFRNLDTAAGTITQNVKLIASDGAANDLFGLSVSLSGNTGLVGAWRDDIGTNRDQGSAYFFRNLDTATGTITQNVKLIASDGAGGIQFGIAVSHTGSIGLVGAIYGSNQGSVYLFRNLDTATGTITQNIKLTSSDGASSDLFGHSVGLDGDQFVIGANNKNFGIGKAYSGSVSSITTLDVSNASRTISQISFISQDDWIIGQTTDTNQVTLSAGDTADVTATGKVVRIGQNAGSDNNRLIIDGTLTATQINVGAVGNAGNILQIGTGGTTGVLSTSSVITNRGSLVFNRSVATTQGTHFGSAAITGTGSLVQAGTGTTTLNTAHTYTGDTIIKVGTLKLHLSGNIANSANIIVGDAGSSGARLDVTTKTGGLVVGATQTLKGIGQVDGNVQFLGTHSPGNSPGLQTFNGNLTYATSSSVNWELAANVSTDTMGVRGTGFDAVNVIGTGILSIQSGVTSNLLFNAAGSTVDWNNVFWDSNHTWLVYDNVNAPTLASGSIFSTVNLSTDSLGATLTEGTFAWSAVGNDVYLNFTAVPIPEPSTWVLGTLVALGLAAAGIRQRRVR